MVNSNFKHIDPDEFHDKELILHDCVADRVSCVDGILRFHFPDGFWVTPNHKESHCDKVVRTNASAVDFSLKNIDDAYVRVFTRNIFKKTYTDIWEINKFVSTINNGECSIEFIYQYRTYFEQMWHCVIHSKKKPYYRECQLHLPETEATFFWNDLRPDREW